MGIFDNLFKTTNPATTKRGSSNSLTDWLHGTMNTYGQEALGLRDEENQRYRAALGDIDRGARAIKPVVTNEVRNKYVAGEMDRTSGVARDRIRRATRDAGGAGSFGGGAVANLTMQNEFQRRAELQQGKLGVLNVDVADKQRIQNLKTNVALNKAQVRLTTPGMQYADFLGQKAGLIAGLKISEDQIKAAQLYANASESAGNKAMFGNIVGGILSAI